jgi:hypothetical protein
MSIRGAIVVSSLFPVGDQTAETAFAASVTVASPVDQANHEIRNGTADSRHNDQILPELGHQKPTLLKIW